MMKSLFLIICVAVMFFGCKKDKPIEKSQYTVWVIPNLTASSDTSVHIKYRISGTDIKTIDNLSKESSNDFNLPKGKSTTIKASVYDGPGRDLFLILFKDAGDSVVTKTMLIQHGTNEVGATFIVQ